ncbi:glycosyltransferase family 8 protein [Nostoc sp. FACHB-280]|uniref:glycosyltransferase family 8 protein n=1 Tax=Nostoc sp. FACHB-280 TaxID=2692839 RepID=UPI00168C0F35|nr:glycosyltransferase family 8 protein [Nostoc sp. FACHB-280]MBD2493031.1 glycosyltransferase family 8 protein [Nostoc sp. FACHB-280]
MSISVVCTIDNNYAQHCAVMLSSLFQNNKNEDFTVYILTDGLSSENNYKLNKFLSQSNKKFQIINIDKSLLRNAPISHHISLATYFRLFIPQVIPSNIDKVLFLDSDMIIRQSIDELWQKNIDNYSHAATIAVGMDEHPTAIGLPKNSLYFNAGLMLINLKYWRDFNIFDRGCELISQQPEKLQWHDQDTLNILLHNSWLPIDLIWNSQVFMDDKELPISSVYHDRYEKLNYAKAKSDPKIVHFVGGGSAKPWHYACKHPFKHEYAKYLQDTPWKDTVPIGKPSLISQIRFRLGVGSKLRNLFQILTKNPV